MSKIPASKIHLQKIEGHRESTTCIGSDAWEQANRVLRIWSTYESRNNKVNFVILYEDGYEYRGRLELPWFESASQRTEPDINLGAHILEYLEHLPHFPWFSRTTQELARQDVLMRLSSYEVGDPALQELVNQCIQRLHMSTLE